MWIHYNFGVELKTVMKLMKHGMLLVVFTVLLVSCDRLTSFAAEDSAVVVSPTVFEVQPTKTTLPSETPSPLPEQTQPMSTVQQVTPMQNSTPTANPYITPTPDAASQYAEDYNPLTGQVVIYPENLLRSPLMVKISNYPRDIRPQAGLSKADIVFEYYIGSSMNRFLAVFYGENTEWAGPIRSGRLIDAQLALNYHSSLVYGGADDRINTIITNPEVLGDRAVDTRMYDQCPPLCGEDTHSLEGLYVDTAGMSEDLISHGYDQQLKNSALETISFADELPDSIAAEPKTDIEIIFSNVCRSKWIFDANEDAYFRWEEEGNGSPDYVKTTDLLNPDGQLRVENVLILLSDYVVYDLSMHDIRIHYADGIMPAVFFRNGLMIEGFWSGLDSSSPLKFVAQDGVEYPLAPGKSWVVFLTDDSAITDIETGIQFEFTVP